jgi:hypothetical protein
MFFGGVGPKSTDAELPAEGRTSGTSGTSGILGILTRTPAVRPARTRGLRLPGDCQVASRS